MELTAAGTVVRQPLSMLSGIDSHKQVRSSTGIKSDQDGESEMYRAGSGPTVRAGRTCACQ